MLKEKKSLFRLFTTPKIFQQEKNQNIKYLYFAAAISFLTILPLLIMATDLKKFITVLLLGVFLLLISKLNKVLFSLFLLYVNIVNIIQTNVAFHWGYTGRLFPRIETALTTPKHVSSEYLITYVDYRDYLVLFYVICVVYFSVKLIRKYKRTYPRLIKTSIIISSLLFLILQNQEPFKIIKETIKTNKRYEIITKRNSFLKTLRTPKVKQQSNLYDKVIVILGESANKNFLNVYGYKDQTTPFLTKEYHNNNLYVFNAIAASNQTRYAVPMFLTQANIKNWEVNFTQSASIITDFKNDNYKTHWISAQDRAGEHNDYITTIANEAHQQKFLGAHPVTKTNSDITILDFLKQTKENRDREMYLFHLIGSHPNYAKRSDKTISLHKNPSTTMEHYANTVYLTDHVIKSITQYFEKTKQNVLVIYTADHGEVVHSDIYGHGFQPSYKDEYDIPLVVYSNRKNSRLDNLKNLNKKYYFNGETFNHFVKYIAGMTNEHKLSFSDQVFNLEPSSLFSYDNLKFYK